ncbi:uncharacterized protein LOC131892096 isoform X1 [Tigriopus californicus]|uniref:uncharacterized protein LOC131892096 isoform X1 n=1 Tax=Tigriopus californicus TaxID=6832 RepID=UPI0027DA8099|nr:uncharacterized protein LOC131892096 isoform X1 [Tigriopus californicus]
MIRFRRETKAKGLILLCAIALVFMFTCQIVFKPLNISDIPELKKFAQDSQKCDQINATFPKTYSKLRCDGSTKWLNSTCFSDASLWFPISDGAIDCSGFVSSTNDINRNLSIVFIGDSRGRQLFTSFAGFFHSHNESVLIQGSSGKTSLRSLPLSHLKLPNWATEGALQQDFETFGCFRENLCFHLLFVWDPLLEEEKHELDAKMKHPQPDLILVSVGVWYLAEHRKRNHFDILLDKRISMLGGLTWKPKVVIYQTFESLRYIDGIFNLEDVHKIQNETILVLQKHAQTTLMDSHLPLFRKYVELCQKYPLSTPDKSWKCKETNHMGFVVIDQATRLILSFIN